MPRSEILQQVKSAIREPYAWPGGYPVHVVLADGAMLCKDCARTEYRQIARATRHGLRDGWRAAGSLILWETTDGPETCAHCGAVLASAYGDTNNAKA